MPGTPDGPEGRASATLAARRSGERPLSTWERELREVLVSPDPTGRLAHAIEHLVVSGGCDCCRSFDLRDTRRRRSDGWPSRWSEAVTPDRRWRFVLWTDDDGSPCAVEEATEAAGAVPSPRQLCVRSVVDEVHRAG
jgi:hypothetical protein